MSFIIKGPNKLIDLDDPKIMGVINLTPDSFYAGSRVDEMNKLVNKVSQMIEDGADIIDLGAMSSRPGARELSISEELDRLVGPLMAVRAAFPDVLISIDTYRSEVLKACIDLRVDIVNDISGGKFDEDFLEVVAKTGLPYILMHIHGTPATMQLNPTYDDVILDIMSYLDKNIHRCRNLGIEDIIIDPGFGFGKSLEDNYKLLAHLSSFEIFERPILVGVSRKSMIYQPLGIQPQDALNGSTALHMLALQNGAKILRVHDVKEAKQCLILWQQYQQVESSD